jgi:hypothetical protein
VAVPDSAQTRERCDVDDVAGTLTWRTYNGSSLLTNVVGSSCGVSSLLHLYTYPPDVPACSRATCSPSTSRRTCSR